MDGIEPSESIPLNRALSSVAPLGIGPQCAPLSSSIGERRGFHQAGGLNE